MFILLLTIAMIGPKLNPHETSKSAYKILDGDLLT